MLGGVLSFRVSVLGNAGWVGVVNFFVVVVACYRDLCVFWVIVRFGWTITGWRMVD